VSSIDMEREEESKEISKGDRVCERIAVKIDKVVGGFDCTKCVYSPQHEIKVKATKENQSTSWLLKGKE
jgi:hypothetical protein